MHLYIQCLYILFEVRNVHAPFPYTSLNILSLKEMSAVTPFCGLNPNSHDIPYHFFNLIMKVHYFAYQILNNNFLSTHTTCKHKRRLKITNSVYHGLHQTPQKQTALHVLMQTIKNTTRCITFRGKCPAFNDNIVLPYRNFYFPLWQIIPCCFYPCKETYN